MRRTLKSVIMGSAAGGALLLSLPVLGQSSPESLLPPGFGDAAPAPSPAPAPAPTPSPAPGPVSASPSPAPSPAPSASDSRPASGSSTASGSASSLLNLDEDSDLSDLDDALQPQYYLAAGKSRSMRQVGVLTPEAGGVSADAFGEEGGEYLTTLIRNLDGPLISRWGSIMLRRVLLSKVNSPDNVNPADWVAERAWRLLMIGEADAARALVLEVDGGNYTPRLYTVAMQAHLATADPAGICPYVPGGARVLDAPTWKMFGPICASLSGEQSRATVLLRQARRNKTATGIDYLLAEKVIGAGFEGRRAVTIKWDDIQYFNNWRYGLGMATGVEPPARLYGQAGRHVQGWRVRAPMLLPGARMNAADTAAALGVLSNSAMVDLYAAAYDDPETSDDLKARASLLRQAYTAPTAAERINAMQSLWNRSDGYLTAHSAKILTARAAARIPASAELSADSGALIASMLTAGLDRNAARWARTVETGSEGWALLAVGAPGNAVTVDYDSLDDFKDADESEERLRSQFLLAALAGLGRVDADSSRQFAEDLELDLTRQSRWTRAIGSAATRRQQATVALLAAVGMQGRDWRAMSPLHLYHVTRALRAVGMEPEARMIAAEALSRV